MTQPSSGVLGDVALAEDRRTRRVHTTGDELGSRDARPAAEHGRVGRHGQRVQVGDEVVGVELVLQATQLTSAPM